MDYDPIKDRLVTLFERSSWTYRVFLWVLHLVFLRAWHVRRALRHILRSIDGPRVDVLDAGTGFGQYTDWLLRIDPRVRVRAVDIKDDYLERLSAYLEAQSLGSRVQIGYDDLTDLRSEGPFDLVLSVDVMEHIEEDVTVFGHFDRVMKPGARLVINTPSDQGGSGVRAEGDASFIGEHVRDGYGKDEIRKKLGRAGLVAESVEYTYGRPGSLAWQLLIRVPMGLLSRSTFLLPIVLLWYVPALPVGLLLNALDLNSRHVRGTGLLVVASKPSGG